MYYRLRGESSRHKGEIFSALTFSLKNTTSHMRLKIRSTNAFSANSKLLPCSFLCTDEQTHSQKKNAAHSAF